jgi:hypothetical protein
LVFFSAFLYIILLVEILLISNVSFWFSISAFAIGLIFWVFCIIRFRSLKFDFSHFVIKGGKLKEKFENEGVIRAYTTALQKAKRSDDRKQAYQLLIGALVKSTEPADWGRALNLADAYILMQNVLEADIVGMRHTKIDILLKLRDLDGAKVEYSKMNQSVEFRTQRDKAKVLIANYPRA